MNKKVYSHGHIKTRLPSKNFKTSRIRFFLLCFCMSLFLLSSAFATQWFENFEDQPLSNNATIYDNGSTSWNSTVLSPSFTYHGVADVLGTKAFKVHNAESLFITDMINTTNATSNVDVSFIFAVLDLKDKFDADDQLEVYIKADGGLPVLAVSVDLQDFDKEDQINKGNLISFQTNYDVFELQFYIEADHPDERIALDNILVEWLEVGETPVEVVVNSTIFNSFNTTLNNNVNVTTFVNNTINLTVNVAGEFDDFDGFPEINELAESNVCPLSEGSTDKDFYLFMIFISVVLFAIAFWIDNSMVGIISSLGMMYMAFIIGICSLTFGVLFGFLGAWALLMSVTQMSISKV